MLCQGVKFSSIVSTPPQMIKNTFSVIGVHCIPTLSPLGWCNSVASFHIPIFACEANKSFSGNNKRQAFYTTCNYINGDFILSPNCQWVCNLQRLSSECGKDKTGPFWVVFSRPTEIIKLGNPSQVRDQTICRLNGRIPATNFLSSWLFTAFDNAVSKKTCSYC